MPSFLLENRFGRKEGRLIAGCDEAGRGPLAGPVVAAAVMIPAGFPKKLARKIDDSKQLSHQAREELYPEIIARTACAIAFATVDEIDILNILRASLLAMGRAVEALRLPVHPANERHYLLCYRGEMLALDGVLVDGNIPPPVGCPAHTCVGGDAKSVSIAAASILAKVARDRLMKELHQTYPYYGFDTHMGYGTPVHLEALKIHGPCPHHRQSFAPVRESRASAVPFSAAS